MYILHFNHIIRAIGVALVILLSTSTGRVAAQTNSTVSFAVHKEGKGRPMIFIPGWYCSGAVWDDAVKHFSKKFTCYTLTLPGFAGQPPIKSDSILLTVVHQLAAYIRQEKLEKPVIVGHSLGGWLALAFGVYHPDLSGDIVVVSSGPFMPALSGPVTVEESTKTGEMTKETVSNYTVEQLKQFEEKYILPTLMRDSVKMKAVAQMAIQCDFKTQGEVFYELWSTDLRPLINRIPSRILALGDWIAYKDYGFTRETIYSNLQKEYKEHPVTISINDSARHFIMFDEPEWFYAQVDSFVKM